MRSIESDSHLLTLRMRPQIYSNGWHLLVPFVVFFLIAVSWNCYGLETQQKQGHSNDIYKQQLNNNSAEISMLQNRIDHLEQIMEDLQNQLEKNRVSDSSLNEIQSRLVKLEASNQSIAADLRQLRNHSNETAVTVGEYRQNLVEVQKSASIQIENTRNLEAAVRSLMEIVQAGKNNRPVTLNTTAITNENGANDSKKTYKVKPGDTLEKIARENSTTVLKITQANQLKKEQVIKVGQELSLE